MLDATKYWKRIGRANLSELQELTDDPSLLWENGYRSASGLNNRLPVANAVGVNCSLYLLYIDNMRLEIVAPGTDFGDPRPRVQGIFTYRGSDYSIRVTDPLIEEQYLYGSNEEFMIGECYATISLGEPYEGYCYKYVAAIITPGRARS
ncbi:MAG: hypothetical protein EXR50_04680 [Dehalococcoidia bacterium]|nr:hypothetical protein [Dehalococcoidia bacterium]